MNSSCCGSVKSAPSGCCGGGKVHFHLSEKTVLIVSLFILIFSFCIGYFDWHFPLYPISDPAWIVVVLCGFPIFKGAYANLFHQKKITSSLLISIAMLATIGLQFLSLFTNANDGHSHESFIFAAGEIAFLMALGEFIEERTVNKARAGIHSLMNLAPQKALKKVGADFIEINASEIKVGDTVLIRPNAMISVDGKVIDGGGLVDQSGMTGEPLAVEKSVGDSVLAGTWNKSGSMTVLVEKEYKDSAISKLISLVAEAEGKKSPIARVASKWASYVVPAAILFSVLVFIFAKFILNVGGLDALVRAATILVVFCPCAFAIATPTAIAAAMGNLAKRGVLIKSGEALEEFSRVDTVVFDKTGTLTKASLKVENFATFGISESEFLTVLASVESHSEHPIAKAILDFTKQKNISYKAVNLRSQIGLGLEADLDGKLVNLMSFEGLKKSGVDFSFAKAFIEERLYLGETLVCMQIDKKLVGVLSLSDEIRENAKQLISNLKSAQYKTLMLSGDNAFSAKRVANELGLDEFFAPLLPAQKTEKITELKAKGKSVCMIGDGVNDAPSLANANVSVAMAALGSDLAIETASAAFLNDKIENTAGLLSLAKTMMLKIKFNFAISLAISFSAIILSAYGFLGPVGGALLHNLSSVIVVLNSASLLRRRKDFM